MSSKSVLNQIVEMARPHIEAQLDAAEQIAALREYATQRGFDWSQIKALLKAQIQDERDDAGDGKRVRKIVEKADAASAYAGLLGFVPEKVNDYNSFAETPPVSEAVPGRGEYRESCRVSVAAEGQPSTLSDPEVRSPQDSSAGPVPAVAGINAKDRAPSPFSDMPDIPQALRRVKPVQGVSLPVEGSVS